MFIYCEGNLPWNTHLNALITPFYTLRKKRFQKGYLAVPIGEPYLVPGRTFFGSMQNYFGFHVEPSGEGILHGTQ
jgi:hypothetical protein